MSDAALERILEEEGLETTTEGPAYASWLRDVSTRFFDEAWAKILPDLGTSAPWVAGVILAIAAILAVGILWQLYRFARAAGPRRSVATTVVLTVVPPRRAPARADVEALLAAGDAQAALATLWRWVAATLEARGLARAGIDRTNRELFGEVRRNAPGWTGLPTFGRLTNRMDALLYAGVPIDSTEVRALLPLADELTQ